MVWSAGYSAALREKKKKNKDVCVCRNTRITKKEQTGETIEDCFKLFMYNWFYTRRDKSPRKSVWNTLLNSFHAWSLFFLGAARLLDQFGVTASSTESNGVHLGSSGSWYIVSCLLHQASFIAGTRSFVWGVFGFRRKVLSQDLLSNIFSWFKVCTPHWFVR